MPPVTSQGDDAQPVLTLYERRLGGNTTSFANMAIARRLLVVAGPVTTIDASTRYNALYWSATGRRWANLSVPGEGLASFVDVLGGDGTGVYVQREMSGMRSLWRITANASFG